MDLLHVQASVHGRVLVDRTVDPDGAIVGFHGYAQTAEDMLEELRRIPGAETWIRVSIEALHPFYNRRDSRVVASWMTSQDRELAIADNIAYVRAAIDCVRSEHEGFSPRTEHEGFSPRDVPGAEAPGLRTPALRTVYVGFSQGVAMAYRAALHSPVPAAAIIALAGDIPPELKSDASLSWPPVLIGVGDRDDWYTGETLDADVAFLQAKGIPHEVVRFQGGHEWTDEFRVSAGRMLTRV